MTINEYQKAALRTASSENEKYPRILNGIMKRYPEGFDVEKSKHRQENDI